MRCCHLIADKGQLIHTGLAKLDTVFPLPFLDIFLGDFLPGSIVYVELVLCFQASLNVSPA